eukprot:TRINITY_DN73035_c0_g1_i1.p1 TRINITY_DN73035_c0_g1~~TRINITY_DN73035_c0_g1_i1.p1  ORF type:complete len:313 (-),score=77.07 TRINITY_DN73035_c0_g1_i1:286-1224(-)
MGRASEVLFVSQRDIDKKLHIVFATAGDDGGLVYTAAAADDPQSEKLEFSVDAKRLRQLLPGHTACDPIDVEKVSVEDHESILSGLLSTRSPEALLQKATAGSVEEERPSTLEVELSGPVAADAQVQGCGCHGGAEAEEMVPGRDFLACCDVKGTELTFGTWYHKRGSGRGGVDSYDICSEVYLSLSSQEQATFVKIDSFQDILAHMGPPPQTEEVEVEEDDDTQESAVAAAAAHIDVAKKEVVAILQKQDTLTADDVLMGLLSRLKDDCPPFEAVRAAMVQLAKTENGLHYERGSGDSASCVLRRLRVAFR